MTFLSPIPSSTDRVAVLASALRLRIAGDGNLCASVFATVLRQLAGVLAPCPRKEILDSAEDALADCLEDGLSESLEDMLEDLIVGGDIDEQPALVEGGDDSPVLVFACQPGFLQIGSHLHIVGVAPDDAPFLPSAVADQLWTDGGLRYLVGSDQDLNAISELLARIGLRELSVDTWTATAPTRAPAALLDLIRSAVRSRGVEQELVGLRWMAVNSNTTQYRQRWVETAPIGSLAIARAPQAYGADAWYAVEQSGPRARFLKFPLAEFPEDRACDLAWRVRLALDAEDGTPSCYRVSSSGGVSTFSMSFPIPLRERRALAHIGGRRAVDGSVFRLEVPSSREEAVVAVLNNLCFRKEE